MNEREAIEKLIQLQKVKIEEVGKCGYTIAIDTILKQLQAYKDKEDKLRDYIQEVWSTKLLVDADIVGKVLEIFEKEEK